MNRTRYTVGTTASFSFALALATQAHAASMQKVNQSDWQAGTTGLPSYVNMYIYVPDKVAAKPPIVVIPHHCQGTASSSNSENSGLETIANTAGFIIIFPEATGENCWDAGSTRSLKHGGGGDTGAIVQMVKYTLGKYNGDASRVYSVGGSSGGIMTEALLGVYPDVFMAGISIMGVPCGCWASGYNDITGTSSTAQWSGACAGGTVTHTGKEWGDLVRSYFPGYTGHRPRMQHWHGTADTTLNYKNLAEDVKEWTNLLGISETPSGSDTPKSGTTRQYWKNSCGYTVYETFSLSGVGHAVSVDGATVAAYFGIDKAATTVDPETAACGSSSGGAGSTGGASSVGGSSSATGGKTGAGGTSSAGGSAPTGGRSATGGTTSVSQTGGRTSTGGSIASTTGGAQPATGGSTPDATGGKSSTATGGANATGGSVPSVTNTGGSAVVSATGGTPATGGATSQAGDSSKPNIETTTESSSGCGCAVPGQKGSANHAAVAILLAALGMFVRRHNKKQSA